MAEGSGEGLEEVEEGRRWEVEEVEEVGNPCPSPIFGRHPCVRSADSSSMFPRRMALAGRRYA